MELNRIKSKGSTDAESFVLSATKKKGRVKIHASRELQPMELMEVTANILSLVPDNIRKLVCDTIVAAIETKKSRILS
jgi:hypothetical protein